MANVDKGDVAGARQADERLVIFDLDGTLLDTLEDLHLAINHTLAWAGLPEQGMAETRAYVGNGIRRLIERSVPAATPAEVVDELNAEFDRFYAEHCNDHTAPYPGIPELLERLRAAGVRCAVVSNKTQYAVSDLVRIHFPGAFEGVVGVREGVAKKPAPDMVALALAEMGDGNASNSLAQGAAQAPRPRAVYVGDSEVDVATAKNSGLPCLAVNWGFRSESQLKEAGATTICATTAELEAALLGQGSSSI